MGWPKMAKKSQIFRWFTVAAAAASPARPVAVRSEIPPAGSSGCCAPPRPARVTGGRLVVSRLVRSLTARNCTKGPTRFLVWRDPS